MMRYAWGSVGILGALVGWLIHSAVPVLAQTPPQAPMPVSVAAPVRQILTDKAEFTGRFEASGLVEVRPQVSGTLESVHFTEGSIVRNDDLLFVIDPRTYQANVDELRAQLEVARTRVDLARSDLTRGQELRQGGNIAAATLQERQQAFLEAQANVQAAQAALNAAELNLSFTRIEAPISGRIGRKLVTEGNLLAAGANSQALTTIAAVDPIHFYFSVDEQSFLRYKRTVESNLNQKAEGPIRVKLAVSDETSFTHDGYIDFADNRLDTQTGTLLLRVVMLNPNGFLTPGLFGRVQVEIGRPYEALLVPDAAIQSDQTRKVVMTVNAENVVVPKPVELGDIRETFRVIRSGLTLDDKVVVNGLMRARPGAKVTPQPVNLSNVGGRASAEHDTALSPPAK
jgi:RND family efflux transporter MFP subunit